MRRMTLPEIRWTDLQLKSKFPPSADASHGDVLKLMEEVDCRMETKWKNSEYMVGTGFDGGKWRVEVYVPCGYIEKCNNFLKQEFGERFISVVALPEIHIHDIHHKSNNIWCYIWSLFGC
jgi:hypothetical protein